ncbi:MAG: hypothetical protein JW779_03055 [Candidatus Thorarchaeota archaeon]|nr:hypothetical protein [Candidatus Thorarchaeota archaeon]
MGSIWFSKKAFLYFGGAAVILLGGLIVVLAPYHYINFSVIESDQRTFEIFDESGYYPQLEVSVSLRPLNQTTVYIDLSIFNNVTMSTTPVNLTLTEVNQLQSTENVIYEYTELIDLAVGNYTIHIDSVEGSTIIDLGLNQVSDSRLYIVSGGLMNIGGILMGIGGYFVPGTFLPSDSDTIIDWGYEEEKEEQGN